MPKSNRRTYPIVTATVVFISIAAIGIRIARPLLPLDPPNRLKGEPSDYLQQGAHQQVDWRPVSIEALELAKSKRKVVLLLIGASWSELGRIADREVFSDPDIEALIAKHFVPIRIDVQDQPQWMSALLPLNRAGAVRDSGFQVYFLDPEGRVLTDAGQIGYGPPLNAIEFGAILQGVLDDYNRYLDNRPDAKVPGEAQVENERALLEPSLLGQSLDQKLQLERTLRAISKRPGIGFSEAGTGQLRPLALRYLLKAGQFDAFRQAAAPYVTGNLADWLDGGFFEQTQYTGRRETSFDKRSRSNALMMEVLAEAYCVLGDPIYKIVSKRTFEWLVQDMAPHGVFFTARIGDELPNGRSARSSISVAQLRESLDSADLPFARDVMGLRVETNPMMTIRIADPERVVKEFQKFDRIRLRLRSKRPTNARIVGPQTCDVSSYVSARLTRTAMLLGDANLAVEADRIWTATRSFGAGSDVRRSLQAGVPEQPILADYLAFADACLQRYLATGDLAAKEQGSSVLERAAFLFQSSVGIWLPGGPKPRDFGILAEPVPEVLDVVRESETAMAIRLCWAYGFIGKVDGSEPAQAQSLREFAIAARDHIAGDSNVLAFYGSSCYLASQLVDDNQGAWVGKHDFMSTVQELNRSRPFALTFYVDVPASEGVYLASGNKLSGPMSIETAIERLAPLNP